MTMKKSFYNEDTQEWNSVGVPVMNEIHAALKPIFAKYKDDHYVREIAQLVCQEGEQLALSYVFDRRSQLNEQERLRQQENLSSPELPELVRLNLGKPQIINGKDCSKIDAVKTLRNLTGVSLKDAKDWVESNMAEYHPEVYK
jgi:hypothetical protein